jgi:ABC transporter substrate binding protein (PQQ-dependent alcohol dehydrogenase system)
LAQFLVWKRWPRWFLIEGSHDADRAFADALRRAAARFGARIVEERVFEDRGGARTTDSGHVQVQQQLPVFTQGAAEHDVVIVADESQVFATYLPYHTWDARPVAGSAGLVPKAWSPAHEQWGAIQLQNRFRKARDRTMRDEDILAWMAVRMVGEAVTRAGSTHPEAVRDYVLSDEFELAGFKGEALTVRPWNNQLRQPVLLATDKSVVSVSPQEGFLHPGSFLDTLGYDRPESECALR